jgi:hypothetical protein
MPAPSESTVVHYAQGTTIAACAWFAHRFVAIVPKPKTIANRDFLTFIVEFAVPSSAFPIEPPARPPLLS